MNFKVKSWGWVGGIYHKVESMIQEVDDIMKEKVDPVGQNPQYFSENKKKFSSIEAQASLQQAKEIHYPLTDGMKLDSCFRETNDTNTATHKLLQSHDVGGERLPPNAEEQSLEAHSSMNYVSQEPREPPVNGIIVECDESEEGHTEATSNCKSTLNCGDEASQVIIGYSEITQSVTPYSDLNTSESEPATQVAGLVPRHSSMSLGLPSEIGEIDRPTASGMTRNLEDDESNDSGSSTPSLVDLMKEMSVESPVIDLDSSLSDNNGTTNVKKAVLESSKCKDELASVIEKDLHEILLLNTSAVDGKDIDEREVVTNSLPASPVRCDESHLQREFGETCAKVEISSDLVTYAPNAASGNISLVAITAKLMELEALTYDISEKSIMDGSTSKLSHYPLSGIAACGIDEPVPLANLLEEDKRQFQDSGTSDTYFVYTDMETIDLDDKVEELQESCASIDVGELFAVSERVKRFRSIKRKILDAFASRRRTAKEYEQLGILHGELNFEHDRHLMLNSVSFQDGRSSIEHPDDSDWELL